MQEWKLCRRFDALGGEFGRFWSVAGAWVRNNIPSFERQVFQRAPLGVVPFLFCFFINIFSVDIFGCSLQPLKFKGRFDTSLSILQRVSCLNIFFIYIHLSHEGHNVPNPVHIYLEVSTYIQSSLPRSNHTKHQTQQ